MRRVVACSRGKSGDVIIPDTVAFVDYSAFSFCNKITSIRFSGNYLVLGEYAFFECDSLKTLSIPINTNGDAEYESAGFDADIFAYVYTNYYGDSSRISEYGIFQNLKRIYFEMSLDDAIEMDFYRHYVSNCDSLVELYYKKNDEYIQFTPPVKDNGEFDFGQEADDLT
jgi:hypothetical protein